MFQQSLDPVLERGRGGGAARTGPPASADGPRRRDSRDTGCRHRPRRSGAHPRFEQFVDLRDDVRILVAFLDQHAGLGFGRTAMPPAVPGVNSGACDTKWSSRIASTCGLRSLQPTPGAAVTVTKSPPKKTFTTSPVSKIACASGLASAASGLANSRVPCCMTGWPGRNLRLAGLGVVSVSMNMPAM